MIDFFCFVYLIESCNHHHQLSLADGVTRSNGVYEYTIIGQNASKLHCDMARDGGGWTLVLVSRTSHGWDDQTVRERSMGAPGIYTDYSILGKADLIKATSPDTYFEVSI